MKKFALLAVFLALPFVAFGQTAKVIALSPADAAEAKSLYAQRDAIEKKIADLHVKIEHAYVILAQPPEHPDWVMNWKPGWGGGFQFSEDFKFIVPLYPHSDISPSIGCGGINWSGCIGGQFITTPYVLTSPVGSITALTQGTLY